MLNLIVILNVRSPSLVECLSIDSLCSVTKSAADYMLIVSANKLVGMQTQLLYDLSVLLDSRPYYPRCLHNSSSTMISVNDQDKTKKRPSECDERTEPALWRVPCWRLQRYHKSFRRTCQDSKISSFPG